MAEETKDKEIKKDSSINDVPWFDREENWDDEDEEWNADDDDY